jgi:hypothetical protein
LSLEQTTMNGSSANGKTTAPIRLSEFDEGSIPDSCQITSGGAREYKKETAAAPTFLGFAGGSAGIAEDPR